MIAALLATGNYLTYGTSSTRRCTCCGRETMRPTIITLLPHVGEQRICYGCMAAHGVPYPRWEGYR